MARSLIPPNLRACMPARDRLEVALSDEHVKDDAVLRSEILKALEPETPEQHRDRLKTRFADYPSFHTEIDRVYQELMARGKWTTRAFDGQVSEAFKERNR